MNGIERKSEMYKSFVCLLTALVFASGCGVPGGGNKHLGGKIQHYHTKGDELLFVIFTDVPTEVSPRDAYMEHLPLQSSPWKGHIKAEGYHPVEYSSDSETLELCENTYSLGGGRVFLVAADANLPEPKVTQIKLDAAQTAEFQKQWAISKEQGLEALAECDQVQAFLQ
jgi:hypothetical protein